MTLSYFLQRLLLLSAIVALLIGAMCMLPALSPHRTFGWVSLFIFIVLTVAIYFPFNIAAASNNKSLFTGLSMVFILFKLLLSVIIIVLYSRTSRPGDLSFLAPFGLVYISYTVFETWMLGKLGNRKTLF